MTSPSRSISLLQNARVLRPMLHALGKAFNICLLPALVLAPGSSTSFRARSSFLTFCVTLCHRKSGHITTPVSPPPGTTSSSFQAKVSSTARRSWHGKPFNGVERIHLGTVFLRKPTHSCAASQPAFMSHFDLSNDMFSLPHPWTADGCETGILDVHPGPPTLPCQRGLPIHTIPSPCRVGQPPSLRCPSDVALILVGWLFSRGFVLSSLIRINRASHILLCSSSPNVPRGHLHFTYVVRLSRSTTQRQGLRLLLLQHKTTRPST